jgi:hypothetical protein
MREETCRRAQARVDGLLRLCSDDRARREWLWLRAQEQEDPESLDSLERADPDLPFRLAEIATRAESLGPRERRDCYGRALDEVTARFVDDEHVPCDCEACVAEDGDRVRRRHHGRR